MSAFWHPFADMGSVKDSKLVIERGDDVWVFDDAGNRYFDATASLWYANVGHGRKEIGEAVARQMSKLEAYSCFGDYATPVTLELADRLAGYAPMDDAKVFLVSGGGDAIEVAAKLARRYWAELGEDQRTHLIARTSGYHGTHGFGTSLAGIEPNRASFGNLVPDVSVVPHDSAEALGAAIERVGADRVAAFFCEPVIGAGGVYPPAEGYIERCAELCREAGVLFVADSVICGFGRLGTWYGIERWDVEPDMITFAKGVTSGYMPVGGVVIGPRVAEPFWSEPGASMFRHGATYSGHAAACAAGLANLDILEPILARGRELEGDLHGALSTLADHPLVREVRGGTGLMAAVDVGDGATAGAVAKAARAHGVLVRPLPTALATSPPLTSTPEHFELLAGALRSALDEVAAGREPQAAPAETPAGRP